ncbi:MAG: N-(5'-phosphoribosyl)anthranilate isomerase, partial [Chloroflexi bacterium]|nr:N-(5'-phosphoribosyl)anthranilate isomerase [Chloroflexota bacterium]
MSQGRVRVKICGLTNLNDALHAWHCGADLLGFISVPSSPRYVSPPRLAEITTALRQADCTALLVSVVAGWTQEDIRALASSCDLDLIQLHGGESPDFVARLNLPTIIAHRVKQSIDWRAIRA